MINFITVGGTKYVSDVGFGARGQVHPLQVAEENEEPNISPASARLIQAALPAHTDPTQRLWVYQLRSDPSAEWEDIYCFSEIEFIPQDFESMTAGTTFRRSSFFAYSIAMCRMIMAKEVGMADTDDDEIVGVLTLTDKECKRKIRGHTEVLGSFEQERDRLEALKKWFGIEFGETERKGVMGTAVHLGE